MFVTLRVMNVCDSNAEMHVCDIAVGTVKGQRDREIEGRTTEAEAELRGHFQLL